MKTLVSKKGDTLIVRMNGKLNYETCHPLRENLGRIVKNYTDAVPLKIIFNLEDLDFVGSSGISSFLNTLREFNLTHDIKPRYCHVKNEFRKILDSMAFDEKFDLYDSEDRAQKSFHQYS